MHKLSTFLYCLLLLFTFSTTYFRAFRGHASLSKFLLVIIFIFLYLFAVRKSDRFLFPDRFDQPVRPVFTVGTVNQICRSSFYFLPGNLHFLSFLRFYPGFFNCFFIKSPFLLKYLLHLTIRLFLCHPLFRIICACL